MSIYLSIFPIYIYMYIFMIQNHNSFEHVHSVHYFKYIYSSLSLPFYHLYIYLYILINLSIYLHLSMYLPINSLSACVARLVQVQKIFSLEQVAAACVRASRKLRALKLRSCWSKSGQLRAREYLLRKPVSCAPHHAHRHHQTFPRI